MWSGVESIPSTIRNGAAIGTLRNLGPQAVLFCAGAVAKTGTTKNYVVAYDFPKGLLINFGAKSLEYKLLFNPKYQ